MKLPTSESVVFEDDYLIEFDQRFTRKFGLELSIPRDYIAVDKGISLYCNAERSSIGQIKVWFQFKGVQTGKSTSERYDTDTHITARNIKTSHINFWGGFGEPVYLVVYSQKDKEFYCVDCESIQTSHSDVKEKVDIKIDKRNKLDDRFFEKLRDSKPSIRGDIATYRGRPLSVNLDPLRSCIAPVDSDVYEQMVRSLLNQHNMLIESQVEVEGATVLAGKLLDPLELPIYWSIEIGYCDSPYRENGEFINVSGDIIAYIVPDTGAFNFESLATPNDQRLVVFYNADETDNLFGRINGVGGASCSNFSLSYNFIVSPVLFNEVKTKVKWDLISPLVNNF